MNECIHNYFPYFNYIRSHLVSGVDNKDVRNFSAPHKLRTVLQIPENLID